jgi:hypothetical protein
MALDAEEIISLIKGALMRMAVPAGDCRLRIGSSQMDMLVKPDEYLAKYFSEYAPRRDSISQILGIPVDPSTASDEIILEID